MADPDVLHQSFEQLTGLWRDTPALAFWRQAQQAVPDARQAAAATPVAPVHRGLLELVELAPQVGTVQEHRGLDEGDPPRVLAQGARGPRQLVLELFGFEVGQVQGVLQRAHPLGVELPGVAVVHQSAGMALQLQQVQPTRHGDQQITLVDPAGRPGELEGRPRSVRLGLRHQLPYVIEPILLPRVTGAPGLEPTLTGRRRTGLRSGRPRSWRHRGPPVLIGRGQKKTEEPTRTCLRHGYQVRLRPPEQRPGIDQPLSYPRSGLRRHPSCRRSFGRPPYPASATAGHGRGRPRQPLSPAVTTDSTLGKDQPLIGVYCHFLS
ncbi:hypothetical protein SALBM311S_05566 [Streptomyces alboniger]